MRGETSRLRATVLAVLLLSGCAASRPTPPGVRIVSDYGSVLSPSGKLLRDILSPHSGVDFGGNIGDPVIAPADGVIFNEWRNHDICGNGLIIYHGHERYTSWCHMQEVRGGGPGSAVKRGEQIGTIGTSGSIAECLPSCPIVHMELTRLGRGSNRMTAGVNFDPLAITVGCFDPAKSYPTDRLVLTYPVPCRD